MKINKHHFQNDKCNQCGMLSSAGLDDPRYYKCRPSWHQTWMNIARMIAERSYDPRLKVGAIIVSDDNTKLLSLGYNGNYKGGPNTPESSDPGQSGFIHAEVNAIVKCDYNFNKNKVMYLTHSPCIQCAKLIVNADISTVIYDLEYRDSSGLNILRTCGIVVNRYEEVDI